MTLIVDLPVKNGDLYQRYAIEIVDLPMNSMVDIFHKMVI